MCELLLLPLLLISLSFSPGQLPLPLLPNEVEELDQILSAAATAATEAVISSCQPHSFRTF